LRLPVRSILSGLIYDLPPALGGAGMRGSRRSLRLPWSARGTFRPRGRVSPRCWPGILLPRGRLILSGMARGIDLAAHKGGVGGGQGRGVGHARGSDQSHRSHFSQGEQEAGGRDSRDRRAIVSELPLGTLPAPKNSPRHNRIPSGVSVGVKGGGGERELRDAGPGPLRGGPGGGMFLRFRGL
jgi:hypothetical protein